MTSRHRTEPRRRIGAIAAVCAVAALALTSCGSATGATTTGTEGATTQPPAAETSPTPSQPDPDTPTAWGPTLGELDDARSLVASWTPEQLAGQVIVGRWQGTDPAEAASMVSDLNLAGVQLTGANIVDEGQVRAVNEAVIAAFATSGRDFPPVIGVDQEGGAVSHLSGVTTELPAFAEAGRAVSTGGAGAQAVQAAMTAAALELRDLGFTWVFAPVADVTIGSADPTIGSRSPSTDPGIAGLTAVAAIRGIAMPASSPLSSTSPATAQPPRTATRHFPR